MKMIIVLAALVAVALAAPVEEIQDQVVAEVKKLPVVVPESKVTVIKQTHHSNVGLPQEYAYGYELTDGQSRQEQASFKETVDADGKTVPILVLSGSFSYVGPDGRQYTVQYTADENGFRASGAHLPA